MGLGNIFGKDVKRLLIEKGLVAGSVLRIHVNDTNPPKIKYIVIVAIDEKTATYATIFINTDINMNVLNTDELLNLQIELTPENCAAVEHTCYADCSKLAERPTSQVVDLVVKKAECHRGQLSVEHFEDILSKIKSASTIIPAQKEKFNLK